MPPRRRHWLFKSEPDEFSFADLEAAPDRTTLWDGVRNYQARNLLRDEVRVGDRVVYYHSNASPPGVAGFAEVVRAGYPDPTQFDAGHPKYDPGASEDEPRWYAVDVRALAAARELVPLAALREDVRLEGLAVLQRGQRLSIQPVSAAHFRVLVALAGLSERALAAARSRR